MYALVTGVLIFTRIIPRKEDKANFNNKTYDTNDRVRIVDESNYSGRVRLNLINNSKEYINISYYTIINDESMNILFKSLMDAADRGVEVNILLDGIFNNLKYSYRNSIHMIKNHPNIHLKFYEPLNFAKPWTWNNRLHDKTIIVDDQFALIGGRNIGNKYFLEESEKLKLVRDRDVLIYNEKKDANSIITDMNKYYMHIWNHKYSKQPWVMSYKSKEKGIKYREKIDEQFNRLKTDYIQELVCDWNEETFPVKSIEFVHNPIQRLNKEPWALRRLLSLASDAEEEIIVQSPYIIPTKNMRKEIDKYDINFENIEILTNSYGTSPNFPAISGYYNYRKEIAKSVNKLYEYQGSDSIHGKTYIFDEKKSIVGSFNLDSRSSYLSTESYVIIEDEDFAKELKIVLDKYKNNSLQVDDKLDYIQENRVTERKPSKLKLLIIKILSKFFYLFDYML